MPKGTFIDVPTEKSKVGPRYLDEGIRDVLLSVSQLSFPCVDLLTLHAGPPQMVAEMAVVSPGLFLTSVE